MKMPYGVENVSKWTRATRMVTRTNPAATEKDVIAQYVLIGGLMLEDDATIKAGDEDTVSLPSVKRRLEAVKANKPKKK